MSKNRRKSETVPNQGVHHSLGLLDEIRSLAVWGGAASLLLLSGMIVLLCFPAAILLGNLATKLVAAALLGLISVASALMLHRQRSGLAEVRKALIDQMDAATRNSAKAERFYGLSILDPLTGLYNRRFGETRLEEEIARAESSKAPLLVMAMDFDRFKQINDTLGHDAGDMALKEFSRRLQRAVRACDVPIRVGGDEFLVILPDCPPDKVQTIISRMDSIEFDLNGKRVPVYFSYGMAQYEVKDTPRGIIKRADRRLYDVKAAKKAGRAVQSMAPRPEAASGPEPCADGRSYLGQRVEERREQVRRSVRLPVETPVFLIGSDLTGKSFFEDTVTFDVSRHGAAILSHRKLAAEDELVVRRLDTNEEARARVVRVMELGPGEFIYGLAFVDLGANIWGIEFPPLQETEKELGGSLFACTRCNSREVLDASDVTHGDASGKTIVRSCKRCNSETAWALVVGSESAGVTDGSECAPAFADEKAV
jgi:diguanylate cyclase (GGDEF)-like protein